MKMIMKNIFLTIAFSFLTITSNLLIGQDNLTTAIVHGNNQYELLVEVYNNESRKPINDVELYLYELPSYDLITTTTTYNGMGSFFVDPYKEYAVETCKRLHIKGGVNIFSCQDEGMIFCLNGAYDFDFASGGGHGKPNALLRARIAIDSISIGKTFTLENVYYDLDKWNLRNSSKRELNKLYNILVQYPSMVVELSSHTDSRGSHDYNNTLSSNRANSCFEYLVSKGIEAHRIVPIGYGETKLVNECADGIRCSENKHQKNRRTEFSVISFEGQDCDPTNPTIR